MIQQVVKSNYVCFSSLISYHGELYNYFCSSECFNVPRRCRMDIFVIHKSNFEDLTVQIFTSLLLCDRISGYPVFSRIVVLPVKVVVLFVDLKTPSTLFEMNKRCKWLKPVIIFLASCTVLHEIFVSLRCHLSSLPNVTVFVQSCC